MIRWALLAIWVGLLLAGCGPAETNVPPAETAAESIEAAAQPPADTGPEVTVTSRDDAVEALASPNDKTRWNGVRFLASQGADGVPDLVKALGSSFEDVRGSAAVGLGDIGAAAKPAIPALVEALADGNSSVRTLAAGALGAIGDDSALPALKTAEKDPEQCVREAAGEAVRKIES